MKTQTTTQTVEVRADGEGLISHAGAYLLVELVDRLGLTAALSAAMASTLENLSYRERRVLKLRYGLGGEHPRTLDEVGRTFNVTRERIRQIENRA